MISGIVVHGYLRRRVFPVKKIFAAGSSDRQPETMAFFYGLNNRLPINNQFHRSSRCQLPDILFSAWMPGKSQKMESELFGYASGSFSGAMKTGKKVFFELADHGTIFLDEFSD